jgi:hypothetical protein
MEQGQKMHAQGQPPPREAGDNLGRKILTGFMAFKVIQQNSYSEASPLVVEVD